LRVRVEDIAEMTEHLLTKLAQSNKIAKPKISKSAITALEKYRFPGNVRELENILERALALYDGKMIDEPDLNLPIGSTAATTTAQMIIDKFDAAQKSLENYLEGIEKKVIADALEKNVGNKTAAAKQLGMSFRSFRYRLKKFGLE
jgi:two-component system response regulator PilR (NtrC family)